MGSYVEMPILLCEHCDGPIARHYVSKRGHSRGPKRGIRFCSGTCRNLARNLNPPKGHVDRHGYRVLPRVRGEPQAYEHRAVMEKIIGRPLTKVETVHHKNGDRLDNSPENLELWASRHGKGQRVSDLPHVQNYADSVLCGLMSFAA